MRDRPIRVLSSIFPCWAPRRSPVTNCGGGADKGVRRRGTWGRARALPPSPHLDKVHAIRGVRVLALDEGGAETRGAGLVQGDVPAVVGVDGVEELAEALACRRAGLVSAAGSGGGRGNSPTGAFETLVTSRQRRRRWSRGSSAGPGRLPPPITVASAPCAASAQSWSCMCSRTQNCGSAHGSGEGASPAPMQWPWRGTGARRACAHHHGHRA